MPHRYANPSLGLLALRIGLGSVMIVHGAQKLFGMFGGGGLEGTTQFFASLGIPMAGAAALLVGLVEFAGGIAVVLGAWTHIVVLLMAIDMLVAIVTVHLPNGFTGQGGYEFNFVLFLVAMTLFFVGPGHYSIDGMRRSGREAEGTLA
ncbi:MAG TPA: DoxX family protein [Gemmatimonadales bacterium]|nr:DoxX family protein [Gemmatimonadales bacterium]